MNEKEEKISYLPFVVTSICCVPLFAFSDAVLMGLLPYSDNYYYLPILNLFFMAALIRFSLQLEFELPAILTLALIVLLFSPTAFILLVALFGNYDPRILIEFSSSLA
ncbi:MAG: hypothetical protein AB1458_12235 [Bacteroidota bacterium]